MPRWRIKLGLTIPCGILLALLLTGPLRAEEDFSTGAGLLSKCNTAIKAFDGDTKDWSEMDVGFCFGFVRATYASMELQSYVYESLSGKHVSYCIPEDGITPTQAIRIIIKDLRANPERLHETAYGLAFSALVKAFPCEGAK